MSTPTIGELERRIADLESRAEEWDEEIGMVDGEPEPYGDNTPAEFSSSHMPETACFVGMAETWEAEHLFNAGAAVDVYADSEGDWWLTSCSIYLGGSNGLLVTDPDQLRTLADKIEEADQ